MKDFRIISLFVLTLIVSASAFIYSASAESTIEKQKQFESILFVRAYEHGWIKSMRGIYICYGNGKIEKIELVDDLDPLTNADRLATTLNQVSAQGYKFFGSSRNSGAGDHSNHYFTEYVFKK
jgi:hypothetical protein